jgi:hypothetical protein
MPLRSVGGKDPALTSLRVQPHLEPYLSSRAKPRSLAENVGVICSGASSSDRMPSTIRHYDRSSPCSVREPSAKARKERHDQPGNACTRRVSPTPATPPGTPWRFKFSHPHTFDLQKGARGRPSCSGS